MATVIRGDDNFDTAVGTDPDISPNAWHRFLGVATNYTTANSVLDFNASVHTGSNLTESGGQITVSVAGMYLISFMGSRYSSVDGSWDWSLGMNSSEVPNTRIFITGNNGASYDSSSFTVPVQLAVGDTVFVQGSGHLHGSTTNSMTYFTGVRLGA